MPLLTVKNLRTEFALRDSSVAAVDDISFELNEGECLGIVGESGCGKTTTGLTIMRLLPRNGRVASGQILLGDQDLAALSEKEMQGVRGNDIALIPQDPLTSLNPVMKIGKQIGEGYRIHRGASQNEADKRSIEVLEMVGMPHPAERLNQYPHELSGGLRQRVMIAMALVCSPKILIADEPTTALDVTIQAQILDILEELRTKLSMAVVLITHDMGVIAGRTDRVAVMYAGKIIEDASTPALFSRMRHPYTQSLLASVPVMASTGTAQSTSGRLVSIPGAPPSLTDRLIACRFAPRCQFATDECRTQEPPLTDSDDSDHDFACFHPVNGPMRIEVKEREGTEVAASAAPSEEFLTVTNLVKDFPIRGNGLIRRHRGVVSAVANVSFSVKRGETLGLVGESGCGKTTIGRLIVGLETPTSGTITFPESTSKHGRHQVAMARARQRQMMFQDPYSSLDPRKRVRAIVSEPLDIQRIGTKSERQEQVFKLLRDVGLPADAAGRFPHEFSGGQRQRIGLARALALEPQMIVADEPVSALDVSIQAQMLNLMQDLQEEHNLSYILISHDLAVVQHASNRIGVMYLGKLVELGPSDVVFSSPSHHYTAGLLAAVPVPDVEESKRRRGQQVQGEIPSAADPPSGCRFRTRCPAVQPICAETEPLLELSTSSEHSVACHFPLNVSVSIRGTQGTSTATT
jgi:peptide/nickel transport system ATP-binding protein